MNQALQNILTLAGESEALSAEQKKAIADWVKEADKTLTISEFKLDRTEKVKRTTAILLEETIEELEQKRKAVEAQNRELEIESVLERVRAVAMSMIKQDDLLSICETMFTELKKLGFADLRNTMINIHYDDKNYLLNYDFSENTGRTVTSFVYNSHPIVDNIIQHAKLSFDSFTEMIYSGKALDELREFRKRNGEADDARLDSIDTLCYYFYSTGTGAVGISMFNTANQEQLNVLKRFRNVFDLAYKRYVDITNAEAQARESQIQLALERVRARTMAMQKSEELADASFLLDTQVRSLGIQTRGCAFNIYGEHESTEWFSSEGGTMPTYKTPREGVFLRNYEAGKRGEKIHIEEFADEDCAAHYKYLCTLPIMGDGLKKMIEAGGSFPTRQIDHAVYFKYGYLLFITLEPVPEAHDIFIRFAQVFEQTYTRFLDLQTAEAQAREAQIEAGLERVRSRIMAMQVSEELNSLIGAIFEELTKLDISLARCVLSIYEGNEKGTRWWMANSEDPSKAANYFVKYADIPFLNDTYKAWQDRVPRWEYLLGGENKKQTDLFLFRETELTQMPAFIIEGMTKPEQVYLSASFNNFGDLCLVSEEPLPAESFDILLRFAKVFDLSYTRFNDLKLAEAQALQAERDLIEIKAARKKAEDTLTELQATQKQLVQSEKMASLGELTAGIAHEIQNPLNFVNNFSDVSKELLDEMKEALEKGNTEEATEIANDVIQNLEKINHHGKRADAIVKGMLQHSRKSSGQREPTDINALCDEYLRLSYHGLRAKDKSFNATIKTDFDEAIGRINIVPQDIGRVLLNLLTNAFYEVNERREKEPSAYQPMVKISTRKAGNTIQIEVSDNGKGIPEEIMKKIFQPFFTTKPTGKGTGLGLSLSYDIITKEHNGEITAESVPGKSTIFKIILPINQTNKNESISS